MRKINVMQIRPLVDNESMSEVIFQEQLTADKFALPTFKAVKDKLGEEVAKKYKENNWLKTTLTSSSRPKEFSVLVLPSGKMVRPKTCIESSKSATEQDKEVIKSLRQKLDEAIAPILASDCQIVTSEVYNKAKEQAKA